VGTTPNSSSPQWGSPKGSLMTNYAFGRRFFPRALAREPEPQGMPAVKASGAVRVFVLGSPPRWATRMRPTAFPECWKLSCRTVSLAGPYRSSMPP